MSSSSDVTVAISFAKVSKASRLSKIGARSSKIMKLIRLVKLMKFYDKEQKPIIDEEVLEASINNEFEGNDNKNKEIEGMKAERQFSNKNMNMNF